MSTTRSSPTVNARAVARVPDPGLPKAQIEGIFPVTNKIPVALADSGVTVLIPYWPDATAGHLLRLTVNGNETVNIVGVPHPITATEAGDPTTIFRLSLPVANTAAEGTLLVSYRDTTRTSANPIWPVAGTVLVVDRTAPGGEVLPILLNADGTQIIRVLTAGDLVSDQFETLVADYDGIELNDSIVPFVIGEGETTETPFPGSEEIVDDDEVHTNKVRLFFKKADLAQFGDGTHGFGYRVTDQPGNVSVRSPVANIQVVLFDVPGNLLPPIVPAYLDGAGAGDGVVNYDDARVGVVVQIPAYVTPHIGDIIQVNWGGQLTSTYSLLDTDITEDPVTTFTLLLKTVTDAGSNSTLPVFYTVTRNGQSLPSPTLPVNVDLSVAGGPDPERFLRPITVLGASGQVDLIDENDYGQDARANIPGQTNNVPPVNSFISDDVVTVLWDGVEVLPGYTVLATDVGRNLPLPIPANIITTKGPGLKKVTYTIRRELQPPYNPPQYSTGSPLDTDVEVRSAGAYPNDGNPLPEPVYRVVNGDGIIDLISAANGAPVRCRVDVSNVAALDNISLTFRGFEFDSPTVEIPAARYQYDDKLTDQDMINGHYDFLIPRENLRLLCQGYGRVEYILENNAGPTNSLIAEVIVDLSTGTDPTCQVQS